MSDKVRDKTKQPANSKGDGLLSKTFLQLVVVNILIGLIQPLNGLIDSMLTGNFLGVEAMSCYALFLPVSSFSVAISCFFAIGAQICCSVEIGKGHMDKTREVTGTAYTAALVFSVILAALLLLFPTQIAVALGASYDIAEQVQETASFLQGYALGVPAVFLMQVMIPLLQIEGKKSLAVISTVCVFAVNVAGDILNLFVFKGGLYGMAFATSLSYIAGFIVCLVYCLRFSKMFRFSLAKRSWSSMQAIAKHGMPSLTYYGSIVIRTAFYNYLIVSYLDNEVMAVMLVINSCINLVDVAIGGVGDATLLVGGILHGEEDRSGQRSLLKLSFLSGGLLLLLITLIAFVGATPIVSLFTSETSASFINAAARALMLTSLCFVPDMLACTLKKYIQSVGRKLYTSVTNVLCNVVYACGAAFVLVRFIGSDGLFLSYVVSYVAILLTHLIYAQVVSPKQTFLTFDSLLFMSKDDISDEDRAEYVATNLHECVGVTEQVQDFCLERGVSKRFAYLLALVTEEVTTNSALHGFRPGKRNMVVVKVLVAGDKVVLNIKDNCVLFDPMSYYEKIQTSDDYSSGVGIRIIVGLSDSVTYRSTFNMNNLRVEIREE